MGGDGKGWGWRGGDGTGGDGRQGIGRRRGGKGEERERKVPEVTPSNNPIPRCATAFGKFQMAIFPQRVIRSTSLCRR